MKIRPTRNNAMRKNVVRLASPMFFSLKRSAESGLCKTLDFDCFDVTLRGKFRVALIRASGKLDLLAVACRSFVWKSRNFSRESGGGAPYGRSIGDPPRGDDGRRRILQCLIFGT